MNVVERRILDKALHYMNSKTADAIEQGMNGDEWGIASKHRALECMEIMQLIDDCDQEERSKRADYDITAVPETTRKLGRYMGVAGEAPEYE